MRVSHLFEINYRININNFGFVIAPCIICSNILTCVLHLIFKFLIKHIKPVKGYPLGCSQNNYFLKAEITARFKLYK